MEAVVPDKRHAFLQQAPRLLFTTGFYFVLLVMAFSPLLWGAARPWGWYPMQLGIFLAFCCYAIGLTLSDREHAERVYPPKVIAVTLIGFLLFVLVQAVPLPSAIVALISPGTEAYYSFVPGSMASISVNRGATLEQFLLYASYIAAFFVLYAGLNCRRRVLVLIYGLVLVAMVEAVFGIYAMYQQVYVVPKSILDGHFNVARGTYVNPNHYAGYLMTVAALVMGMIYTGLAERLRVTTRTAFTDVLSELGSSTGVWLVILAVIVTASLFSGSRGAPGAVIAALVLMLIAGAIYGRRTDLRILLPLLTLLAITVLWLGAGKFIGQMVGEGLAFGERTNMWALNLIVIKEHWLLGSGAGTFPLVFSAVRDGGLRPLHIDSPHNDYLEALTELGMIGGALLLIFVIAVLYRIIKAYVTRHDPFYRGVLFGSAIAMLGFLIHSIVEFNFHIPANALLFFAVSALGLKATSLSDRRRI